MGHLFILCGPPGSGKTTLMKLIQERQLPLTQVQRMTTRPSRTEEGDRGNASLEYEFLSGEEFAGRLANGTVANFIEWSGNFYATDLGVLDTAFQSDGDFLLYEDMPTAVHLKHVYGSRITVILLFTDDEHELVRLQFAALLTCDRPSVREWKRRLGLKFTDRAKTRGEEPSDSALREYIKQKMARAIPDLAFMAGKIRVAEDIRVLANRKDELDKTIEEFQRIVGETRSNRVNRGRFAFVLMPFRDEFNKIYRFVISPAVESQGLTCLRGDEIFSKLVVVDDIVQHIEASELIISDISGGNPNVFLELGISMKLNKPIILISQDSQPPFNVRTCRCIQYNNDVAGWEKLSGQIVDAVLRVKRRKSLVD